MASLSGAAGALSGMLLRRPAKDLAMGLRGEGAASGLSFFGFFHVGRQLFLTSTSSTGSAAGHMWFVGGLGRRVSALTIQFQPRRFYMTDHQAHHLHSCVEAICAARRDGTWDRR